jgi:type IV secretory pathway protease TraF
VTGKGELLLIGLLIAGGMMGTRSLKVNLSPSVPVGLYWLRSVPKTLERGMLVVLPVPERVRTVHGSIPLLKPIAAVSGEDVCVSDRTLLIQDGDTPGGRQILADYGLIYDSWNGATLPHAFDRDGCAVVAPETVFLASDVNRSLDSRYFGPVAIVHLTARAVPLLTW